MAMDWVKMRKTLRGTVGVILVVLVMVLTVVSSGYVAWARPAEGAGPRGETGNSSSSDGESSGDSNISNNTNNSSGSNSSSGGSSSSSTSDSSGAHPTGDSNGGLGDGCVKTSILGGGSFCDDGKGGGIIMILEIAVNVLTFGIGVAGTLGLVISGVQYLTAGDNAGQIQKAKSRIFNIVIGLAIYAIFWGILQFLLPGGLFAGNS